MASGVKECEDEILSFVGGIPHGNHRVVAVGCTSVGKVFGHALLCGFREDLENVSVLLIDAAGTDEHCAARSAGRDIENEIDTAIEVLQPGMREEGR